MQSNRHNYFDAAYRILRYLKGSLGTGLMFQKNNNLEIEVYTDANYASNSTDKRSTSSYYTFVWEI